MAGIFFSSPYLKGGKQSAKLANLTKYISTREGVELLKDTDSDLPATKQQQDFISRLLKTFPDTREMPEYEDYNAEHSQKNAAEFISQVQENYAYLLGKRENYVDYVANRPGVKKLGDHGLWNADRKVPVLQNAVDEVAHHPGNVWTPVIAIQRPDAERLGYDSADSWRALICSELDQIAKAYKILPSHLKWYAAFHEKERSVHVHLVIFSTDPNEGYLTKPAILELRSALTRQIFKDDLKNIYVQQTAYRDQLQENALEVMESLIQKMQDGDLKNPKLELLITELAERLQNYSGKKVYGYLPPATKRIVDAIVDEFAGDERVAEAYSLWHDMRDEVFSFYSKAKPERVPLSQQKEFKPVRNMVIREVVQMMEQLQSESVEYDVPQYAAPELKAPAENVSSDAEHNTPPRQEHRAPSPESVPACMIRMLHHMGNIFWDNVGTSGYRGLQLDRKRRKELQEWKIALGHREDDHEDPANYPKPAY
ncbi:MAG: MobP3 family relaxase [Oscillospiraceae bacterium]|nr:MobP3 family relaxase [Oscillospiraceae bacterium]